MIVLAIDASQKPDYPIIGWRNAVTSANVAATSAALGYPASNLANPSTANYWLADDANSPPSTTQYLTVSDLSSAFDYVGIARHNFGTAGSRVTIQVYNGSTWVDVTVGIIPSSDDPLFFKFAQQNYTQVRVKIEAGSIEASAAVLYVGLSLVMQRRLYVDHVPLPYARVVGSPPVFSIGGSYLGRIITNQKRQSVAKFKLLDPTWVRQNMTAFFASAVDSPFFFSWRPQSYPLEVGFATLANDPMPAPEAPSNLISVELQLVGVK